MTEEVRVRFAPSPTGFLHIGGVRTALFNWLFARHHQGSFILRIEDTDRERSTEDSIQEIIESMQWLGLDWDEGPFRQMERQDLSKEKVDQLLNEGKAYRCYCSPEDLEAKRKAAQAKKEKPKYDGTCRGRKDQPDAPHVVRFQCPPTGNVVVKDLLRGNVEFDVAELDDFIILRTDGGAYGGGILYQVEFESPGRFAKELEVGTRPLATVNKERTSSKYPKCK